MENRTEMEGFVEQIWCDDPGLRFVCSDKDFGGKFFETNRDAIEWAASEIEKKRQVFYTPHLFKLGSKERKAANAENSRAFFVDIDCGDGKQYPDQETALNAAVVCTKNAGLDTDEILFVDSGYGLHLYLFLDEMLSSDDWERSARQLRAVLKAQGLKFDEAITTDRARIMRIPGSANRKKPADPKPCTMLNDITEVTPYNHADLQAILNKNTPALPYDDALETNDPFLAGIGRASSDAKEILEKFIHFLSVKRSDEYNDWCNVGILIWNVFEGSDEGLTLWDEWSKGSLKYEAGKCAEKWNTFSDDRPDGDKLTVASFIYWCKEDGGEKFAEAWDRYIAEKQVERLAANGYPLTDTGNGMRLIDLHGDKIRYDTGRKLWFFYNGRQWIENAWADVTELAKDVAKKMRLEAATFDDPKAFKALAEHAAKTENVSRYEAMAKAASTDQRIRISVSDFDTHPHLLNVANGVINLSTGELLPHDPAFMMSHCLSVSCDPFARDERFDRFLLRTFAEDQDLIHFVQRALGYSLTGETSEDAFFFCYGEGANGKSSLLEAFQALMGGLATPLRTEALTRHKFTSNTTHNADIAELFGKRYTLASESGQGRRLDMELIKRLTSGDTISASKKYGQPFSFVNKAKIFFMANHKPEIRETDYGTKRRFRYIPFLVQIPKEQQDDTREYLKLNPNAQQAILAWAVRGAAEWYRNGLKTCRAVEDATAQFLNEQDMMARYIAECCDTGSGPEYIMSVAELIEDVEIFYQGYGIEPPNVRELPAEMLRLNFKQDKVRGVRCWLGLKKKAVGDYYTAGIRPR